MEASPAAAAAPQPAAPQPAAPVRPATLDSPSTPVPLSRDVEHIMARMAKALPPALLAAVAAAPSAVARAADCVEVEIFSSQDGPAPKEAPKAGTASKGAPLEKPPFFEACMAALPVSKPIDARRQLALARGESAADAVPGEASMAAAVPAAAKAKAKTAVPKAAVKAKTASKAKAAVAVKAGGKAKAKALAKSTIKLPKVKAKAVAKAKTATPKAPASGTSRTYPCALCHPEAFAELPQEAHPQGDVPGIHSYTLRAEGKLARISVVLKEKMFYIKPVPQNVAGDRTVDKFGGVSLKWRAAGGAGPAFEQAKLLAEWV